MNLTIKQQEGLRIAIERYKHGEPYTCISGYAGTGKSTLVRYIIDALELLPENVAYVAFTGKAALVLKNKGNQGAITAHKFLFDSKPKDDGTFINIPKKSLPASIKLVVVDEVSMLPKSIWEILMRHKKYVIALGDPGQLPAIGEDNGILKNPHVFLDEIMRQAKDSEIIRLSEDVRLGKPIKPFKGSEINIIQKKDMVDGMLSWADQIICGKNQTRNHINNICRKMKWGDVIDLPLVGDKVICLKNNWDCVAHSGDALVNGSVGEITNILLGPPHPLYEKMCFIDFKPESFEENEEPFKNLLIDWKLLMKGESVVNKDNYRFFKKLPLPEQFDYGYAITCHKSQGSEYDKVLVLEEVLRGPQHPQWLYTAITRASKKLTLVLKG